MGCSRLASAAVNDVMRRGVLCWHELIQVTHDLHLFTALLLGNGCVGLG